jgi:predicted ATPase
VLAGRDVELHELRTAAADALASGRGLVALVAGDAGIGKTRLAREVADGLAAEGVTVAWAVCRSEGGAPPYWPWAQLLTRLGRAAALAVPAAETPELARFALFEAVLDALGAAAPTLLVLDDLH